MLHSRFTIAICQAGSGWALRILTPLEHFMNFQVQHACSSLSGLYKTHDRFISFVDDRLLGLFRAGSPTVIFHRVVLYVLICMR